MHPSDDVVKQYPIPGFLQQFNVVSEIFDIQNAIVKIVFELIHFPSGSPPPDLAILIHSLANGDHVPFWGSRLAVNIFVFSIFYSTRSLT